MISKSQDLRDAIRVIHRDTSDPTHNGIDNFLYNWCDRYRIFQIALFAITKKEYKKTNQPAHNGGLITVKGFCAVCSLYILVADLLLINNCLKLKLSTFLTAKHI